MFSYYRSNIRFIFLLGAIIAVIFRTPWAPAEMDYKEIYLGYRFETGDVIIYEMIAGSASWSTRENEINITEEIFSLTLVYEVIETTGDTTRLRASFRDVKHSFTGNEDKFLFEKPCAVTIEITQDGRDRRIIDEEAIAALGIDEAQFYRQIISVALWTPFVLELPGESVRPYTTWKTDVASSRFFNIEGIAHKDLIMRLDEVDHENSTATITADFRGISREHPHIHEVEANTVKMTMRDGTPDTIYYMRSSGSSSARRENRIFPTVGMVEVRVVRKD